MAEQPGWREPMLAVLTEERFSNEAWLYERKLDGVRAICARDGDAITLWSRTRKKMNAAYPEIADALLVQGGPRFVVDGEIVAFEGNQTSFAKLQHRIHLTDPDLARSSEIDVFYYIFDLLHYDGMDATGLPLRQRKQLLREAFDFTDPLRFSVHRNTDGEAFFHEACTAGWEGLIAKRADSRYRKGRSTDWLKFKCAKGQEFVVGGFTDPQGTREGFGALLIGYYEGQKLRYAGKVGTGYNNAMLRRLRNQLDGMAQKTAPFDDEVHEPRRHWVRPQMVVEVTFSEWTKDGKLRHPRFMGVRDDKTATDVVREDPS